MPHVLGKVALGSTINADEPRGYSTLDSFYPMESVDHGRGEYVRGKAHMNTVEGFWELVKRAYGGIHHHWSQKHSQRYIDGCAYRLNCRKMGQADRVPQLIGRGTGVSLPCKVLTQ